MKKYNIDNNIFNNLKKYYSNNLLLKINNKDNSIYRLSSGNNNLTNVNWINKNNGKYKINVDEELNNFLTNYNYNTDSEHGDHTILYADQIDWCGIKIKDDNDNELIEDYTINTTDDFFKFLISINYTPGETGPQGKNRGNTQGPQGVQGKAAEAYQQTITNHYKPRWTNEDTYINLFGLKLYYDKRGHFTAVQKGNGDIQEIKNLDLY